MREANERRGYDHGVNLTHLRAIAIGERLAVLIDYPASPGCTPPYAPVWIAEMVRRHQETRGRAQRPKKREPSVSI